MFDEYPDRLMLEMIVERIYRELQEKDGDSDLEAKQYRGGSYSGHRPPPPPRRGDYLRDLIGVVLNNEMYRRRCRYRRCRRWW